MIRFTSTRVLIAGGLVSIWYPLVFAKWTIRLGNFALGYTIHRHEAFGFRLFNVGWLMFHLDD